MQAVHAQMWAQSDTNTDSHLTKIGDQDTGVDDEAEADLCNKDSNIYEFIR